VLAVLLGVWVTLLFTETLGWVFVGLVVPGYLASVLVVQPTTAAVIVAEALVTYWLARGLAYGLAPTRVWQPFFGRDRFFLIVVASVLVRQHDQLWLLPALSLARGQVGVDAAAGARVLQHRAGAGAADGEPAVEAGAAARADAAGGGHGADLRRC
jgi:hypothetical protein